MRRILLLLTTALAVVVAGCATTVAGTPAPVGAGAAVGGTILPPRPRELRLDDVDPCALLTPAQRSELGLSSETLPGTSDAPFFAGPTCSMTGFVPRDIGVGFALATGSGIEKLLDPTLVRDTVTTTSIADFPAIIAKSTLVDFCAVDVDVAEGQFLDVQFHDAGNDPPIPQDQLCQDATRVAEAAMRTLQSS